MARTRAPAHRVAALAALGTLAGLGAFATAAPVYAAEVVVIGVRTAADALAAVPEPVSPVLAAAVVHVPGLDPAPAPEPSPLPEPCPCLLNRHDPEDLINRLLGDWF
ncbi:hypothetical protein KDL01_13950 [Actinospica durhamensis]|uniref:Uncharacterized protein n=1 Tax=Actinospica durhamensis TaxID=1508375 RepID=A0A941IRY1_9ACTN|nr:hypothetical protein [Actinospica durhamensis]MBR7834373.1 hypothetical protein [Actinospica durhamensis]